MGFLKCSACFLGDFQLLGCSKTHNFGLKSGKPFDSLHFDQGTYPESCRVIAQKLYEKIDFQGAGR